MNVKWATFITIVFILGIILLNISGGASTEVRAQIEEPPSAVIELQGPMIEQRLDNPLIVPAQTNVFPSTMSEGFDGEWLSPGWSVSDATNADGGIYFLGKRPGEVNCPVVNGNSYGWMVGGGPNGSQLNCATGRYPSFANTSAYYGPFDLTNANSSILRFYLRGHSELSEDPLNPFDYLYIGASADGQNFCGVKFARDQGNDPGYEQYSLNLGALSCTDIPPFLGQSRVWFKFNFISDQNVEYIGYFLDDIRLTTTLIPTFTPTRTHTPSRTLTPSITPTSSSTHTPSNTPTNTATGEPTNTPTVTVTPTDTQPVISEGKNFLPAIVKEDSSVVQPPTVTPTPTTAPPTPTPSDCGDVEPNSTRGLAKPLLVTGQFCRGSLEGEGDGGDDYYAVQLEAGQVIEVSLVGVPPGANFDIFLYDPANRRILEAESINPDQNDEFYAYTVPNKGRYLVDVFGRTVSRSAPNSYLLKVVIR